MADVEPGGREVHGAPRVRGRDHDRRPARARIAATLRARIAGELGLGDRSTTPPAPQHRPSSSVSTTL